MTIFIFGWSVLLIHNSIFVFILCFQDSWVPHETFILYGNIQCRHQHALQKYCNCLGSKSSQVTFFGKFVCKDAICVKNVAFVPCSSIVAGLNRLSHRVLAAPLLSWKCVFSRLLWSSSLITSTFCSVPNSALWSATAQVRNEPLQFSSHQNWFLDETLLMRILNELITLTWIHRPHYFSSTQVSTGELSIHQAAFSRGAQARTQAQLISPVSPDSKYIDVGEGPAALQGKFHTVIAFPSERSVSLYWF